MYMLDIPVSVPSRDGKYEPPISSSKARKRQKYYSDRIKLERRAARKPRRHQMHDEKMIAMGISDDASCLLPSSVQKGHGIIALTDSPTRYLVGDGLLSPARDTVISATAVQPDMQCQYCYARFDTTWHNEKTFRCRDCHIASLKKARLANRAVITKQKREIWNRYIRKYKKGKKAKIMQRMHKEQGIILNEKGVVSQRCDDHIATSVSSGHGIFENIPTPTVVKLGAFISHSFTPTSTSISTSTSTSTSTCTSSS